MIGIVGTGMLGEAVGLRLLGEGKQVAAYNRTAQKTARLAEKGAMVCSTPAQAAERCEMVITCVTDAAALRDVALGEGGISSAQSHPAVFDMSTIDPAESKTICADLAGAGITMLDSPVMGGPNAAIKGGLIMMASGNMQAFEAHKKTLEMVAQKIFYMGDQGSAHAAKLAMNLQISMLALSISEGITLARASGLEPEAFLEVLNSTYFATGMSKNKAYKMASGTVEPTFLLRNLCKDLRTINGAAKRLGADLPMGKKAQDIYEEAVRNGLGELDYTGIIEHLRKKGPRDGQGPEHTI